MNRQRGLCHPPRHPGWELLRAEAFDVCPRTGRDFHTDRHAVRLLPIAGQQDGAGTSGGHEEDRNRREDRRDGDR
jgi:hypothetical protein